MFLIANIDPEELYSSGASNYLADREFLELNQKDAINEVKKLWKLTINKSLGAVKILNNFGDLARTIYLYGSSKNHDFID